MRGRANAVSKEFGENRFKQLVKKVGEEKAMTMLKGAPLQRLASHAAKTTPFLSAVNE